MNEEVVLWIGSCFDIGYNDRTAMKNRITANIVVDLI